WRLQNAGSCTWTSAYGISYDGDNLLNAPSFSPITSGTVPPGQTVDITVNLTAPNTSGVYRQNFKLVNASGEKFALGDGSKPFWAQIEVVLPGGIALDFLTLASQAEWRSGIGSDLNIPVVFNSPDEDVNGAAKIKDGAKLETGAISGKVLLTVPKHEANGTIAGTFPTYLVQTGDRLRGRVGFLSNADGSCGVGKVTFQIFTIDSGSTRLLSEWNKTCDGSFLPINIDLSSLKGKNVQFILVVRAGTSFQDDWAIWNSLRVER
ncbi:MAG TPA: NBR1-Ig-like domain-containing protein, partial [Anaerolineales bacterium]|nr:NBR1-Ig-like domain-containing protein [Anaerolineales bacterium]